MVSVRLETRQMGSLFPNQIEKFTRLEILIILQIKKVAGQREGTRGSKASQILEGRNLHIVTMPKL